MTDIVERIDWLYVAEIEAASPDPDMVKTYADAKAEIEHLRADNELLRAALETIEKTVAWGYPDRWETTPAEVRQLARAALEGRDD